MLNTAEGGGKIQTRRERYRRSRGKKRNRKDAAETQNPQCMEKIQSKY